MKTINRLFIPEDFIYYRTWSKVFYEYYKKYSKFLIEKINNWYEFIKIIKFFKFPIRFVVAEKTDIEPNKEFIKSIGIKHWIIHWAPFRKIEKPKGWLKIPTFITKDILHSSRSAFCVLDKSDYWNKWSPKARWHRRKILDLKEKWILKITKCEDLNIFLNIYSTISIKDPNHKRLIKWCNRSFSDPIIKENLRVYVVYINEKILAWAVFIDEWKTSEYFTSFYTEESKPYHLWIAIMDEWFSSSYEKWIKYLDLDHMQDYGQLSSYAGYTKFKESIADYDVYFHDMWVKFF